MAAGLFVIGFTEEEILSILAEAKKAFLAGERVASYSVGGRSFQFQITDPKEIILECQYALKRLNPQTYGQRVTRTIAGFNRPS